MLSGGELPAKVIAEAVIRLLPGVLGEPESLVEESFEQGLLEGPHYTRPEVFRDMQVPGVLVSGNHEEIRKWRHRQSLRRTRDRRKDLLNDKDK